MLICCSLRAASVPSQKLPRARQFINMLGVLEKKTHGRRSHQEDMVLKATLDDLQKKYVKLSGLDTINRAVVSQGLSHAARAYEQSRPE